MLDQFRSHASKHLTLFISFHCFQLFVFDHLWVLVPPLKKKILSSFSKRLWGMKVALAFMIHMPLVETRILMGFFFFFFFALCLQQNNVLVVVRDRIFVPMVFSALYLKFCICADFVFPLFFTHVPAEEWKMNSSLYWFSSLINCHGY